MLTHRKLMLLSLIPPQFVSHLHLYDLRIIFETHYICSLCDCLTKPTNDDYSRSSRRSNDRCWSSIYNCYSIAYIIGQRVFYIIWRSF